MNKFVKRTAQVLGGVGVLAAVLFGSAELKARARLGQKFETHRLDLPLPAANDQSAVLRGQHLVSARYGCLHCHGENLGGGVMIDQPGVGKVLGPNLTLGKGGATRGYSMADWDRVVRHGVKRDGTPSIMPSQDFFRMSDAELSDIVAYVRSRPPVDAEVPAPRFGPVGKVLLALGKLPLAAEHQEPNRAHPSEPPATADSVQFGEHLAATCTACHRSSLGGGPMQFGPPDWPAAANLTPHATGLGDWSYDDFDRALTQGISKDGRELKEPMKGIVPSAKGMLPTERKALWTYLRSVPPVATSKG